MALFGLLLDLREDAEEERIPTALEEEFIPLETATAPVGEDALDVCTRDSLVTLFK
jgi:hypothetical protein